jgi:hypothetical protein
MSGTKKELIYTGFNIQRTLIFDGLGRILPSQLNDPECGV